MTRRAEFWVWVLLPFLVARAFMPVGFMADVRDGKVQIVFCSAGMSQEHGDQDKQHATQLDISCPFAIAAAAPLPYIGGSDAIAYFATAIRLPLTEPPYYAAGPRRLHRVRGPPHA